LAHGADPDALDSESMKAIHAAACVGRVDVVSISHKPHSSDWLPVRD